MKVIIAWSVMMDIKLIQIKYVKKLLIMKNAKILTSNALLVNKINVYPVYKVSN